VAPYQPEKVFDFKTVYYTEIFFATIYILLVYTKLANIQSKQATELM